jgi:hypothetical protein
MGVPLGVSCGIASVTQYLAGFAQESQPRVVFNARGLSERLRGVH